jgi:hypothetical protein
MGTVYEATQLSLDRVVALKLLAAHLSDDVGFRARFKREGQVQARLEHPHIVTVYEAGETEHGLFIAMRLVRGRTLKDLVNARELDPARTLRILGPVGEALDEAHGIGLIHRDIKPQNVLVGARDHSFLADFGLTKGTGETSLTRTGHFVGTFDYISPEQINGEHATSASDVYSLAGVLYECLTGAVPFPRSVEAAILYAHVSEPPPRPTEVRPELPGELDDIVARAMAKDPAERHASAGELLGEVEQAFTPRPPETRPSVPAGAPAPIADPAEITRPSAPAAPAAGEATQAPAGHRTAPGPTAPVRRPVTPARAPAAPARRPAALPLLGVGALALVVAAGFLIGKSSSNDEEKPTAPGPEVTAGALTVTAPSGWDRAAEPVEISGLPLRRATSLLPGGSEGAGILTVGMSNATGPALLPKRLLAGKPEADRVELGELEAWRYARLDPGGGEAELRVYVAPTSGGVATVACALPDDRQAAFLDNCNSTAATLELDRGKAYPIGPDKEYEDKLDSTVDALNRKTIKQARTLRAADTSAAQARAATALRASYRAAAGSLGGATANPQVRGANTAIVGALNSLARGYERLASAARAENEDAYARARSEISKGEERLRRTLRAV